MAHYLQLWSGVNKTIYSIRGEDFNVLSFEKITLSLLKGALIN
jgi:hypothetical protein